MQKAVIGAVILLLAAGATGMYVFGQPTLPERAVRAYQEGKYTEALPLFKKWAALPEVRNDRGQLQKVVAYIYDMQTRLDAQKATTQAASAGGSATSPADQQTILQQALSFALQQKTGAGDPPMGADRIPHEPIKAGETREMAIKELGNFEYDGVKGGVVPADVLALDGGHVRLTGFMLPLTQAEKITKFALVPSLVSCCFGQPPGVQHIITCTAPPAKAVDFSVDEIVVEGIVHVKVVREEGYTSSIFDLDVTSVRAKG